jgi:dTDP-4-amino-4,6-dideoxygalactose transaminase
MSTDLPALLGGTPIRPEGPPAWPPFDEEVVEALRDAAINGAWGRYHGPYCESLKQLLTEYHDVAHCWLCSSGTAAVELALRGVGVQPGDEVILSAYDFKANFTDVLAIGAVPVLADVRPGDVQLDVERLAEVIGPKTKAVIASHLHGCAVDMPVLVEIAKTHGFAIVEDTCQSPGAMIHGRRAGTWGDVGVLSFGGSKLVAAGRGGAVLTSQPLVLERIKRHVMRGNDLSPLSELQAAAIVPQWRRLDERNDVRLNNVGLLTDILRGSGLWRRLLDRDGVEPAFYKVGFWYLPDDYLPEERNGLTRETFCHAMRAEGIAVYPGFRALHKIHASRRFRAPASLESAAIADESIVLLHHPVLLEAEDRIREVADAVIRIQNSSEALARLPIPPAEHFPFDE